jgi:hypothetical protein
LEHQQEVCASGILIPLRVAAEPPEKSHGGHHLKSFS